ncbi:hypothetical protein ABW20_dc0104744 [Dactylellina cionopaga]|nr:hypothetical protein ABW20_dc0104744 [Dactylellina cionopaga]
MKASIPLIFSTLAIGALGQKNNEKCPAAFSDECPFVCGYPKVPADGTTCSYVNITTQGASCKNCLVDGSAIPSQCPKLFNDECPFFCGTFCAYVKVSTQGAVCNSCLTPGVGVTECPRIFEDGCEYSCYDSAPSGFHPSTCSDTDKTGGTVTCTKCFSPTGKFRQCPATHASECPYLCSYTEGTYTPGFCSATVVTTGPAGPVSCAPCAGSSSGGNGTGTGTPPPPSYTGAASALQINSGILGGLFALLFAAL